MISIIIPVYNVAPYIEECIRSVIAQTYTGQMECIIVDDCGTDDSIAICERQIAEYDGAIEFKILHHEHNSGLSAARNTGIKTANGDYLYFMDSDDYITPDCIAQLVALAEKYKGVEMVQSGALCSSKEYQWLDIECKNLPEYTEDKEWIKSTMLDRLILNVPAWNKLVSRQFIINNNLYFKEGIIHEDEHWNFFLAKHVSRLAVCKHNTYIYRVRENSIVTTNSDKSDKSWLTILGEFADNIDNPCREKQIAFTFKDLHRYRVYGTKPCRSEAGKHLLLFRKHLSWIGKLSIAILLIMPGRINVMPATYKFFDESLLPYF